MERRKQTNMKKKIQATAKTVTAEKKPCAAKCAAKAPKAAKKPAKKAVLFTVRADSGKAVYLAGCFNDWAPAALKMDEKKTGVYSVSVKLDPGVYQYKFVVDGEWLADPECTDFVSNDKGTFNSLITVK